VDHDKMEVQTASIVEKKFGKQKYKFVKGENVSFENTSTNMRG